VLVPVLAPVQKLLLAMSDSEPLTIPGFIAEEEDLAPSRGLGVRLLAMLVGFGVLVGLVVAGGMLLVAAVWPTSSDPCDSSQGPCIDVSLADVSAFSGIMLAEGSELESVEFERVDQIGTLSAVVVTNAAGADPLRGGPFRVSPSLPWAAEVDALMLDNVVLYEAPDSVAGEGSSIQAASGQRADGRTVIFIRATRVL